MQKPSFPGFVNTAPLIAGNRRGQVYLLRCCEVTRHVHEQAVLEVFRRRTLAWATSDLG
jgi:hypothetical protein